MRRPHSAHLRSGPPPFSRLETAWVFVCLLCGSFRYTGDALITPSTVVSMRVTTRGDAPEKPPLELSLNGRLLRLTAAKIVLQRPRGQCRICAFAP
jgi:hypothetical protein